MDVSQQQQQRALDHVNVVLCRPQGPQNVGSVARVMRNFGLSHLRVCKPHEHVATAVDSSQDGSSQYQFVDEVHAFALFASEAVVKEASQSVFADVHEACSDCTLVVATSGKQSKQLDALTPVSETKLGCFFFFPVISVPSIPVRISRHVHTVCYTPTEGGSVAHAHDSQGGGESSSGVWQ